MMLTPDQDLLGHGEAPAASGPDYEQPPEGELGASEARTNPLEAFVGLPTFLSAI